MLHRPPYQLPVDQMDFLELAMPLPLEMSRDLYAGDRFPGDARGEQG